MADQAPSSRKIKTQNDPLAESTDILAAAHQLMQLSDEDNNNDDVDVDVIVVSAGKRNRSSDEEVDQSPRNITSAKIKEIFGKDIEVIARPKKLRKYRSLVNIYRVTRPISAGNGTKVRA